MWENRRAAAILITVEPVTEVTLSFSVLSSPGSPTTGQKVTSPPAKPMALTTVRAVPLE